MAGGCRFSDRGKLEEDRPMAARKDPLASWFSNKSFSDPCRFCLQFRATLPLWEAEGGHEHIGPTVDFPVALHGCPRLFLWDDVDRRSGREVEVDSEKWMFASNHCGSPLAMFSMSDSGNGSSGVRTSPSKSTCRRLESIGSKWSCAKDRFGERGGNTWFSFSISLPGSLRAIFGEGGGEIIAEQ